MRWVLWGVAVSCVVFGQPQERCSPLNYNPETTHVGTDFETYALIRCKDGHEMSDKSITKEIQCIDGVWTGEVPICFGPKRAAIIRRQVSQEPPPTPDPNDGCAWKSWNQWTKCNCTSDAPYQTQSRERVTKGQRGDDECEDWRTKPPLVQMRECNGPVCSTRPISTSTTIPPSSAIPSTQSYSTSPTSTESQTLSLAVSTSSLLGSSTSSAYSTIFPTSTVSTILSSNAWTIWASVSDPNTTTITRTTKACQNLTFDKRTQIITYNPPHMRAGTKAYITCRERMYMTNGHKFDVLTCLEGGVWDKMAPLPCTYDRPTPRPSEGCKVEPCPTLSPFDDGNGDWSDPNEQCEDPCPVDPGCAQPNRNPCSKPCVPCYPNYCRKECFSDCETSGEGSRCRETCDHRCEDYCRNTFRSCVETCKSSREQTNECETKCNEQFSENGCEPIESTCASFNQWKGKCNENDIACQKRWMENMRKRGCDGVDADCELTPWTPWGSCSASCNGGCRYRIRHVNQYGLGNGNTCTCDEMIQKENCNVGVSCEPDCDCEWDQWSSWSTCSATCGTGMKERRREVLKQQRGRGKICPGADTETESCSSGRQPQDCQWGSWSTWGTCSVSCGRGGEMARTRNIVQRENECGRECDYTQRLQRRECPFVECSQDCVFQWASWSHCSVTCGSGSRTRQPYVQRQSNNGGRGCPSAETESCFTPEDSAPIEYESWSEWNQCSATCDSRTGSIAPSQTRTRLATRCGKRVSLGGISAVRPGLPGILTNIGGALQQSGSETRSCSGLPSCASDCVFQWESWSHCSVTCGTGTRTRQPYVQRRETNGGRRCPSPERDSCYTPEENAPIEYGSWSSWSQCSASCGSASSSGQSPTQTRNRPTTQCGKLTSVGSNNRPGLNNIVTNIGGSLPRDSSETRTCVNLEACECEWSQWGYWGRCTATCGAGTQQRSRQVARQGSYCPGSAVDRQSCPNLKPCCQWQEWNSWGTCTVSCGTGGYRSRSRIGWPENACRQQYGPNGDKQVEFGDCGPQSPCMSEPIRDCQWSQWSTWSTCSADCGIGSQERRRYVEVQATKDGQFCVGSYKEVKGCDTTQPTVKCPPLVQVRRPSPRRNPRRQCKTHCRRTLRRRRALCEKDCQKNEIFASTYESFVKEMKNEPIQKHIRIVPKKGGIEAGKNMQLVCETDIPVDEHLKEHIVWLQDGSFCNIHKRRKLLKNGGLLVRRLRPQDAGNYTCAVASSTQNDVQGIIAVSQPFQVHIKGARRLCADEEDSCIDIATDEKCEIRSFRSKCCRSCRKLKREEKKRA